MAMLLYCYVIRGDDRELSPHCTTDHTVHHLPCQAGSSRVRGMTATQLPGE